MTRRKRHSIDDGRCSCCRAEGASWLCAPCRDAHGADSRENAYIASLRCPVREEAESVDADLQEMFEPGSTILPHNGHSEECWTTTPMHLTPEIHARCPKCSAPQPVRADTAKTRARYEALAGMEQSVGYRSGQGR